MGKIKNRKKMMFIIAILFVCLILILFLKKDVLHYKFDDEKIIGSTRNEIINEYGEFNKVWNMFESNDYYQSDWQGLYFAYSKKDSNDNTVNFYYIIYFDENDIAIHTKLKHLPID